MLKIIRLVLILFLFLIISLTLVSCDGWEDSFGTSENGETVNPVVLATKPNPAWLAATVGENINQAVLVTTSDPVWTTPMQESGKDTGVYRHTCPENMVMIGRHHEGDENKDTKYRCAKINRGDTPLKIIDSRWTNPKRENVGGFALGCMPDNTVMIGRYHRGDENKDTKYQCGTVQKYNGRSPLISQESWTSKMQESGKDTEVYEYICPTHMVMVARYHEGDENKYTRYMCGYLSYPFDTVSLDKGYVGENTKCVWQKKYTKNCPPYVYYYKGQKIKSLKLQVENGKLVNSAGNLFDTRGATEISGKPRAIFVMTKNNNIYATVNHMAFFIHHSSLVNGGPVAAAGEMSVINGIIQDMTNCSGHYKPSLRITEQVIDSLRQKGYTDKIDVVQCPSVTKRSLDDKSLDYKSL